ncbi:MAG: ABC transporter ATP-binding protein [Candidatus Eremiobacteraeota bacterium]|nr:ABC transporter ATP-binding protein [Candidatus Eremiobacteraeota bacterium]
MALLEVHDLAAGYGDVPALHGVTLKADRGEIVALVGSNGAGKSSLLKAISGLLRPQRGFIRFDGQDLARVPAHEIVALGIAHVPEGRRVFATATVRDNLLLGAFVRRDAREREERLAGAFRAFPRLEERLHQRASTLSGGEQQMLAIARGTMSGPKLLMLDEPSLGLAPKLIPVIYDGIKQIASDGTGVLLVEQNVRDALSVADRAYVLQTGKVVAEGSARELLDSDLIKKAFLGL